jgi:2-polyprenyl-6-methoxyphenol hydroxylase-like FAD-dependent oxidoreductase
VSATNNTALNSDDLSPVLPAVEDPPFERPKMTEKRTAYIIGASVGGLLAAAALSDRFDHVVLIERDELADDEGPRRGVPQGRHLHGLLSRGLSAMETLLPGLTGEIVAAGAPMGDVQEDFQWMVDGKPVPRATSGLRALSASRPFLERHIRTRVAALSEVEIRTGQTVTGLIATPGGRVTGVHTDAGDLTGADLVVDASGRGSRARQWLVGLGYPEVQIESLEVGLTFVSQYFKLDGQDLGAPLGTLSGAWPGRRYGVNATLVENGIIQLTFSAIAGAKPPVDEAAMLALAEELQTPVALNILRTAEPIGPVSLMRFPVERRVRFDRMDRFPEGFLAVGDAVCSFNPTYGQGLTVAGLQALLLREVLDARFLSESAKIMEVPWAMVMSNDRRYGPDAVQDPYMTRLRAALPGDPELTKIYLSVANLVLPPTALRDPEIVARIPA